MFFDPTTKPEVKADPFSLESLIAWLEKQPAEESSCYLHSGTCLLSQYFTAQGFKQVNVGGFCVHEGPNWKVVGKYSMAFVRIAQTGRTFGHALERARAVAAKRK